MRKRPIRLKETDLMNIVKRVIKEQVKPAGHYVNNPPETVGAHGCCPQLYLFVDFINGHLANIENIISIIQQATSGEIALTLDAEQMDIFNDSIVQAQNAIENAEELYNDLNSTGCCKSLTGKSATGAR